MSKIISFTSWLILVLGVVLTLFEAMSTKLFDTTITSKIYIAIFLMLQGLLFVRGWIREAKTNEQERKEELKAAHIFTMLKEFKQTIEQWQLSANTNLVVSQIQDINEKFLLPLNHQHQLIKNTYGQNSLDMIVNLAQAERLLNRIQSAVLDGYIEEAQDSYNDLVQTAQQIKIPAS